MTCIIIILCEVCYLLYRHTAPTSCEWVDKCACVADVSGVHVKLSNTSNARCIVKMMMNAISEFLKI